MIEPRITDCCGEALAILREVRDKHRERGDLMAYRIVDRALVAVARKVAKRKDAGRRDDEPEAQEVPRSPA